MDFLKIIIWPVVVLVGLLMFRTPISSLICAVKGIEHKKGKDGHQTKISFIEEALKQPKEILEITNEPPTEAIEIRPDNKQAILNAYSELERLADEKIKDLQIDLSAKGFKNTALYYFEYKGAFSPKILSALQDIRVLRNQVAHYSAEDIKAKDAEDYLRVVEKLKKHIDTLETIPAINLNAITTVIRALSIIIDKNNYQHVSIQDIHEKIRDGSVLHYIAGLDGARELKHIVESKLYEGFDRFYVQSLQSIYYGYAGDERKKWGIEHSGICLLLAWTNEIVQLGSGWYPETNLSEIDDT